MTAPVLSVRLTLEHAVRSADGGGGYVLNWEPLGMVWAAVTPRTGRARGDIAGPVSVTRLDVTVRATPIGSTSRPVAGQRFRTDGRTYAIRSVFEKDAAGFYLTCACEEEVTA